MNRDFAFVVKLIVAFVVIPVAIWHLHPVIWHWHPAPGDSWSAVATYLVGLVGWLAISVVIDADRGSGR